MGDPGQGPAPADDGGAGRGVTNTLLAGVLAILVAHFLRATASVTLPLAFALFLVAVHWPIVRFASRFVPRGVAVLAALVVFGAVMASFGWMMAETLDEAYERSGRYEDRLERMVDRGRGALGALGVDLGVDLGAEAGEAARRAAERSVEAVSRTAASAAGGFVLLLGFFGLGLAEVRQFREKMLAGQARDRWLAVARRIGAQFQRYVVVRTVIGLLTGVLSALGALIIGLDFWYLWGVASFLLNYIPTLGSVLAVIPPTLFALVQFESWAMALLSLGIQGGMQLVMGTWIDPLLQGKALSLSPLVVLVALTFWGWVWGVGGALLAVPLTIFVALVARELPRTRWIATLLQESGELRLEGAESGADGLEEGASSRA